MLLSKKVLLQCLMLKILVKAFLAKLNDFFEFDKFTSKNFVKS